MCAVVGKPGGVELPKPFDIKHGAARLSFPCWILLLIWSNYLLIMPLFLAFGWQCIFCAIIILEVCDLLLNLQGVTIKRLPWFSEKTWTFQRVVTEPWEAFEDGLNTFSLIIWP